MTIWLLVNVKYGECGYLGEIIKVKSPTEGA